MYPREENDVAASAVIYMAIMLLAFVLFAGVPFFFASRPILVKSSPERNFKMVDREIVLRASHRHFPVAQLKQEHIVDLAGVAKPKAKVAEKAKTRQHRRARVSILSRPLPRHHYVEKASKWHRATYPDFTPLM